MRKVNKNILILCLGILMIGVASSANLDFVSPTSFSGDLIFNDSIIFNLTSGETGINVTLYDSNDSLIDYSYDSGDNFFGNFIIDSPGIYYINASTSTNSTEIQRYLMIFSKSYWNLTLNSTVEIGPSTPNGPEISSGDEYGSSIANIGDLDLDGVQDIAVGAGEDDAGLTGAGCLHIHFMNRDGSIKSTIEINYSTPNGPNLLSDNNYGSSVVNLGDLDLDGIQDLFVGAYTRDSCLGDFCGSTYVHFMNRDGSVKSTVEINSSTPNGPSLSNGERYGHSVANLGDLDLDGVQDVLVGGWGLDSNRGSVYIHFMNRNGSVKSTVPINSSTPNGASLGANSYYGTSVANLGDLDLDGVQDIVVGATGTDSFSGSIFLHFMNRDGSIKSTVEINSSSANGPALNNWYEYGSSVANVGDLNSDGIQDFIVGATYSGSDAGSVFVHFMNRNGSIKSTVEINSSTSDGPSIFAWDEYGSSVVSLGDLDSNGLQDIAVGGIYAKNGGDGSVYIHNLNIQDVFPPEISVLSPSNGQTFTSSSVLFSATASEDVDLWMVNYDGVNRTLSDINTSLELEDGNYNLEVWARDLFGNFGLNDLVSFSVNLPSSEGSGSSGGSSGGSIGAANPDAFFINNTYAMYLGEEKDYSDKNNEIDYGYAYYFSARGKNHTVKLLSLNRGDNSVYISLDDSKKIKLFSELPCEIFLVNENISLFFDLKNIPSDKVSFDLSIQVSDFSQENVSRNIVYLGEEKDYLNENNEIGYESVYYFSARGQNHTIKLLNLDRDSNFADISLDNSKEIRLFYDLSCEVFLVDEEISLLFGIEKIFSDKNSFDLSIQVSNFSQENASENIVYLGEEENYLNEDNEIGYGSVYYFSVRGQNHTVELLNLDRDSNFADISLDDTKVRLFYDLSCEVFLADEEVSLLFEVEKTFSDKNSFDLSIDIFDFSEEIVSNALQKKINEELEAYGDSVIRVDSLSRSNFFRDTIRSILDFLFGR